MRLSVIIAAHNEGEKLWKTIESCAQTCVAVDHEIVVSDDGSNDGSIEEALSRFPRVKVVRSAQRQGASPAKASGAAAARGETLVFLDGHCKPEPGAVERLVGSVELLSGRAIITSRVGSLCTRTWQTKPDQIGSGYYLKLDTFDCGWLAEGQMASQTEQGRTFFESPALIGCALAISRELYDQLGGFDPHMRMWGVEDLDLGLRCWLLGSRILHDPVAVVGHRFQSKFENYSAPNENLIANQLRMARKNFTHSVWVDWVDQCRQRSGAELPEHPEGLWARAWQIFEGDRLSAEAARSFVQMRRTRDEFWYATRFGLTWPSLSTGVSLTTRPKKPRLGSTFIAAVDAPPSPSPPPCDTCKITWANGTDVTDANRNVLPGHQINLKIACTAGTPTNIQWTLPGFVFRSYIIPAQPNQPSASLTLLSPTDLMYPVVQFYWADVSPTRLVIVAFSINGVDCVKFETFNVLDPDVTFFQNIDRPETGTWQLVPSPPDTPRLIQLLNAVEVPDTVTAGAMFNASVSRPVGFGFGPAKWQFGQLISGSRLYMDGTTATCKERNTEGLLINDNPWPFPYDSTPIPPPYPDGNITYTVADSPFQRLLRRTQAVGSDSYKMYIMFMPAPDPPGAGPSSWVPLRSVAWRASFCAQVDNGEWVIFDSTASADTWIDDRKPPTWFGAWTTIPFDDSACPGDCT